MLRIVHSHGWQLRLMRRLVRCRWLLRLWLWWLLLLDDGLLRRLHHGLSMGRDGVGHQRCSVVRRGRHGRHGMGWGAGGQHEAGRLHDGGGKGHGGYRRESCHDGRVHVRRLEVYLRLLEEVEPAGDEGRSLGHRRRLGYGVTWQQWGWGCGRCGNGCHWDGRCLCLS